jgi:hypothetical protein
LVVISPDGSFIGGPVHAFNLAIGPGMIDLGQPMFDAKSIAQKIKG